MTITRKVRPSKLPLESNQSLFAESFNQQPKTSRAIPPSMMLLGATCIPSRLPGPSLKRIAKAMRHDAAPRMPQIVPARSSCCWRRFMGSYGRSLISSVAMLEAGAHYRNKSRFFHFIDGRETGKAIAGFTGMGDCRMPMARSDSEGGKMIGRAVDQETEVEQVGSSPSPTLLFFCSTALLAFGQSG